MNRITKKELYDLDYTKNPYLELCVTLDKLAEKQAENIIYAEIPFIEDVFLKIKRPGKYVFNAETKKEALALNKKVKEVLAEANKSQKKMANKKVEKRKKLYLKTKIIQGGEDVKLSVKPAYRVKKYTKNKAMDVLEADIIILKSKIQEYKNKYKKEQNKIEYTGKLAIENLEEEIEWYKNLLKKIQKMIEDTKIKIARQTGNLWRLTYWAAEQGRRKQVAFGDVVIFWGDPRTNVAKQSRQKMRTDTRFKSKNYIDAHPSGYFVISKA